MDIHVYVISLVVDLILDMVGVCLVFWIACKGFELFKSGLLWVMNYIYVKGE